MAKTVNCPNCDAPLALDPSRPTLRCDYCKRDVTNPAHKSPIVGATPRKGKAGLIVGIVLGGVMVLGGLVGAWLIVGGSDPAPAPDTAVVVTSLVAPAPTPASPATEPKRGPRIRKILGTEDLTGDGIGDVAFSSFGNPKVNGLQTGGVGLLDGEDGKLLWHKTYPTDSRASQTRTACHGVLVVQDNTRSIIALEGNSGAQRWRLTLSDYVRYDGMPAGTKERPVCLFATVDKAVSAVDVKAGKLLWRHEASSAWGLRDVQAGADTVLFRRTKQALDLFSGEARKTGITETRRTPPHRRSSLVLSRAHAYHRSRRGTKVNVHRTLDWKKLGQLKLPGTESPISLYPQGDHLLAFNAFKPPIKLCLLDGAQLTGPVEVSADEKVVQARLAGETILMLTATYKGTRRTTLRAYDLKLEGELWNAQLDASGKAIKFTTKGPNFGGLGGSTSGRAKLAAVDGLLLMELAPANRQGRISVRDLRNGKVLGEIALPARKRWTRSIQLQWIHTGPKRAFVRYNFGSDGVTALDPATRKVVWTYAVR